VCRRGDFTTCVINGRKAKIDRCIAPIIDALNAAGIVTAESCCGHGEEEGHILAYQDGEHRLIIVYEQGQTSEKVFQARYRRYAELSEEKTKRVISPPGIN